MFKKILRKLSSVKKPIIVGIAGLLLIIVVASTALIFNKKQENNRTLPTDVVFRIDGKDYKTGEVDALTKYVVDERSAKKDDAAKAVYESLTKIHVAETAGVTVPQGLIDSSIKDLTNGDASVSSDASFKAWADVQARANALDAFVQANTPTGIKGQSFVFYFGQKQQYDLSNKVPGAGDANLIKSDRDTAERLAKQYHDLMTGNKSNGTQLLATLNQKESRTVVYPSKSFDSSDVDGWQSSVYFPQIIGDIKAQQSTGTTDIKTGKAKSTVTNKDEDMYFYFVNFDAVPEKKISKSDFDTKVNDTNRIYEGYAK